MELKVIAKIIIKKGKKNQRVADKNEVRGSDPGTLQNRNLLVKMYKVRSSEPTGNTVIFRSSDITDNKTGSGGAGANVRTWSPSMLVRTSVIWLFLHKTEDMPRTVSAGVIALQKSEQKNQR